MTLRQQVPTARVSSRPAAAIVPDDVADTPVVGRRKLVSPSTLNPFKIAAGASLLPMLVVALVTFLSGADQNALLTLLPQMRATLGYDLQFLVAFGGAVAFVQQFAGPLGGYLADRVPRNWLMRVGALVTHLSAVGVGLAATPITLLSLRGLSGFGNNIESSAKNPLLADYYPPSSRGRVFAFTLMFGTIGGILSPVVVGIIAYFFGWRMAFLSLGGFGTLVSLLYFLVREPVRGEQDRLAMGADAETAREKQAPARFSESLRAVRAVRTVTRIWVATIFTGAGGYAVLLMPVYLFDKWHLGVLVTAVVAGNQVATLVGQLLTGFVVDRMLRDRPGRVMYLIGAMGALACAGIAMAAFAPVVWVAIAGSFILSAANALMDSRFSPPIAAISSLTIPARIRGFGMQTFGPFSLVGTVLVFTVVGQLTSAGAGYRGQLLAYIPMYVIGGLVLSTAALSVDRDIRAALAASMADEEAKRARESGAGKLLVCRSVEVTFDGAQVLFGVDFDATEGEIVALLGTNGSGKSTLLRAISGVHEADGGAIVFDGVDITHAPAHLNAGRGIVMVPGGRAIFPGLSVRENLAAAERLAPGSSQEVSGRRAATLELFPILTRRMNQAAGDLSGGEQQMLALAQALMLKPRLLMVDELTLGLAPQVVEVLLAALRNIHRDGATIVLVEQSVNVALTIAERAVFMEKGRVTYDGPTSELVGRGDVVHSTFLGGSARSSLAPRGARATAAGTETGAILQVSNLSVVYGGVRAVDGVDIEIAPGEVVGFIGPNGAGKSTLFDAISGFTRPASGTILFLGTEVTGRPPDARARAGLLRSFQNVRLFSALTVRENIAVAFERHLPNRSVLASAVYLPVRAQEGRVRRRTQVLLETLGLVPFADKFVSELSTGSRRIVDLACLLAAEPKLLLLDEPSSGLAQAETEELGPLIGRIARETGCAIMVVEHDVPLVASVSDRLCAMAEGRIIALGAPAEVMADPAVIRAYLGASPEVISRSGLMAAPVAS